LKPPPFEYRLPDSLEEALSIMAEYGDEARPLAGGQSLVPLMAFRLARPAVLVDLNNLDDLASIDLDNHHVNVGAMVREKAAERSDTLSRQVPLLARALPFIGHEAIRTRGTIGGSLAHADPAAELPAVAVATGAHIVAASEKRGQRALAAEDFFITHFTTALEPDELVTQVQFPAASEDTGVAFQEVARRHGDFAMVGVAATLHVADGIIDQARIVLTGMADKPVRARAAETTLVGSSPTPALFEAAAAVAAGDLDPPSDLHGSTAYRRHVATVLVGRSLQQAAAEIGGNR
jgi:CO/xanthine dehydrogenase FAD-binding subunit